MLYNFFRLCLLIGFCSWLFTSCNVPRECYANGGKPIAEDSKQSVRHFNSVKK